MSADVVNQMVARVNAHDLDGYDQRVRGRRVLHGYPPGVEGKGGRRRVLRAVPRRVPDIDLRLY